MDPVPAIGPGAIVAGYRVLQPIGGSELVAVYLAEHLQLGRRAAIKVVHPALLADAASVARFFADAALVARLTHPGVVSLFDYGMLDGGAYLIMEHLPGESLRARLARRPRPSMSAALDIGTQLAMTLAAAHEAGLVHRDLRPSKIQLVPDPAGTRNYFVKVLDFGVAALTAALSAPRARRGDSSGTPYYTAPEHELDPPAVDHRCDVYSLGCVLYQLTTGALPFGGSREELMAAHRTQLPLPPRTLEPAAPPYLDSLLLRMMAKSPRERPGTMMEVVGALSAILRARR
jgi:serine/threonine-protein kinase